MSGEGGGERVEVSGESGGVSGEGGGWRWVDSGGEGGEGGDVSGQWRCEWRGWRVEVGGQWG